MDPSIVRPNSLMYAARLGGVNGMLTLERAVCVGS